MRTPTDSLRGDRIVAGTITLAVAVLLGCLLWLGKFHTVEHVPAAATHPSLMSLEEEYVEPGEFMESPVRVDDAGEPDPMTDNDDTPAPTPAGEPELSNVRSDRVSVSGNNPKTNNSAEKLVTQKRDDSPEHANPSKKDTPDSKISSEVGSRFATHNGTSDGKQTGTSGSSATGGGAGSAVGHLDGARKLLTCNNKFPLKISKKITVIVEVTVNDKGRVVKAKCKTALADKALAQKLESESLASTWTPKAGAPDAKGTITWTLVPSTK